MEIKFHISLISVWREGKCVTLITPFPHEVSRKRFLAISCNKEIVVIKGKIKKKKSVIKNNLQVIAIYPSIMPANLTAVQSNRVCNALALMQCVASHKETRGPFLQGRILENRKRVFYYFYWKIFLSHKLVVIVKTSWLSCIYGTYEKLIHIELKMSIKPRDYLVMKIFKMPEIFKDENKL